MDEVTLLKRNSLDSIQSEENYSRFSEKHRNETYIESSRVLLAAEIAILACVVVATALLAWLVSLQHSNAQPKWLAGTDLSGVIPSDISGNIRVKPWIKHNWQVPEGALLNTGRLNETLEMWESLKIPFIKDSLHSNRGPEIPLPENLFEISAFHQVHCLAIILEDFVNLALGVPVHELPSNKILENRLTWTEHTAHCFNYVLDAILCFADSTSEGSRADQPGVVHMEAKHVCNDFQGLLDWAKQPEREMPSDGHPVGR